MGRWDGVCACACACARVTVRAAPALVWRVSSLFLQKLAMFSFAHFFSALAQVCLFSLSAWETRGRPGGDGANSPFKHSGV